jgi:hypothetical protein
MFCELTFKDSEEKCMTDASRTGCIQWCKDNIHKWSDCILQYIHDDNIETHINFGSYSMMGSQMNEEKYKAQLTNRYITIYKLSDSRKYKESELDEWENLTYDVLVADDIERSFDMEKVSLFKHGPYENNKFLMYDERPKRKSMIHLNAEQARLIFETFMKNGVGHKVIFRANAIINGLTREQQKEIQNIYLHPTETIFSQFPNTIIGDTGEQVFAIHDIIEGQIHTEIKYTNGKMKLEFHNLLDALVKMPMISQPTNNSITINLVYGW